MSNSNAGVTYLLNPIAATIAALATSFSCCFLIGILSRNHDLHSVYESHPALTVALFITIPLLSLVLTARFAKRLGGVFYEVCGVLTMIGLLLLMLWPVLDPS